MSRRKLNQDLMEYSLHIKFDGDRHKNLFFINYLKITKPFWKDGTDKL